MQNIRQIVGLIGIVLAVMAAQLNDAVVDTALPDISGGLGISMDAASWIRTVFVTGEVVGMCAAPSLGLGFSFRRFALFAIGLSCISSLLMALGGGTASFLVLRLFQGLSAGFTIPLVLILVLRLLGPAVRIYGLMIYALTATFFPNLAISFSALWTDAAGDWRWILGQALPICSMAGACVWWGLPQEPPQWARLREFDWPGVLLVATGFGSLSVIVEQGNRLDWFDSQLICLLSLLSGASIAALIIVERFMPVPLIRWDLLKRRNFAYAIIGLFSFLIISLSSGQVPLTFLEQVQGYRPLQAHALTLVVAAAQLLLLPATALIMDHKHVDARWVNLAGLVCIMVACFLDAHVVSIWNRDQFYAAQGFQAVGSAFVVMPLLMMGTNTLKPEEGPFGSAMINTPRVVSEAVGVGALMLINRWRGGLHRVRIVDLLGQNRFLLEPAGAIPSSQGPSSRVAYGTLNQAVEAQVNTLTTIDTFIILGALALALVVVLAVLPERTYPPRIQLAK